MAKKKYYYYVAHEDGRIKTLAYAQKVMKNGIIITKEDYDRYIDLMINVEEREGYYAKVTVYVDFTRTIEYISFEEA